MKSKESLPRINFGSAIKSYRHSFPLKLSQEKLSVVFNTNIIKKPFVFNQKTISRLEKGDSSLTIDVELVTEISKICKIPSEIKEPLIAELSNINTSPILINVKERKNLLTSFSHEEFTQYLGNYNCVFFSTDSHETKIVHGTINISPSQNSTECIISLNILDGESIIKKYKGVFFINKHYEMCYSILIGELKQEVCMLIFKNIKKTIGKNIANIALALTTSSGNQKRPTTHRMLISRHIIEKNKLELIMSQLKLNTDIIYISESSLSELEQYTIKILNNSNNTNEIALYNSIKKCTDLIRILSVKEIYHKFDEALIYDTCQVSDDKLIRGEVVSIIRSYTDSKYYNKVSQTVQDIVLEILEKDN